MNRSNWRVERRTKAALAAVPRADDDVRTGISASATNATVTLRQPLGLDTSSQHSHSSGIPYGSTPNGLNSNEEVDAVEEEESNEEDEEIDDECPGAYAITRAQSDSSAAVNDEWDPTARTEEIEAAVSSMREVSSPQDKDMTLEAQRKLMTKRKIIICCFFVLLVGIIAAVSGIIIVKSGMRMTGTANDGTTVPAAPPPLSNDFFSNACAMANGTISSSTSTVTTTIRYDQLRSAFHAMSLVATKTADAIDEPGSPQRLALCWLSDIDRLQVAVDDREELIQRFAMAVLYFTWVVLINDPFDPSAFRNWLLSDVHECDWDHVNCDAASNEKVRALILSGRGLVGKIPAELALLTNLVSIDVSRNMLSGEIPSEIWTGMPQLTSLDLSFNELTGTILQPGMNLSALKMLAVSTNSLTGIVPIVWDMPNLITLSIADTAIEGPWPDLSSLTNLGKSVLLLLTQNVLL